MGRPPLPPEDLKAHRVVVHLTTAERDALAALAYKGNTDLGAAAREIIVRVLVRQRTRTPKGE